MKVASGPVIRTRLGKCLIDTMVLPRKRKPGLLAAINLPYNRSTSTKENDRCTLVEYHLLQLLCFWD